MAADHGGALGEVVELGDVVGDEVVAVVVFVFCPGVEVPVGEGEGAGGVCGEDGAGVAEPDAVRGPEVEVEAGHVGAGAFEHGAGAALGGLVVDEQVDVFHAG